MSAHYPEQKLVVRVSAKYVEGIFNLVTSRYVGNSRVVIQLFAEDGELQCTVTTNIPEIELDEGEFICKNYSENKGIVESLLEKGVILDTGKRAITPFVDLPICRFSSKVLNGGS